MGYKYCGKTATKVVSTATLLACRETIVERNLHSGHALKLSSHLSKGYSAVQ